MIILDKKGFIYDIVCTSCQLQYILLAEKHFQKSVVSFEVNLTCLLLFMCTQTLDLKNLALFFSQILPCVIVKTVTKVIMKPYMCMKLEAYLIIVSVPECNNTDVI